MNQPDSRDLSRANERLQNKSLRGVVRSSRGLNTVRTSVSDFVCVYTPRSNASLKNHDSWFHTTRYFDVSIIASLSFFFFRSIAADV